MDTAAALNPIVARHLRAASEELRAEIARLQRDLAGLESILSRSSEGGGARAASGRPGPSVREAVLAYLKDHDTPVKTSQLADAISSESNVTLATVRSTLTKMLGDKQIGQPQRGWYTSDPDDTPNEPASRQAESSAVGDEREAMRFPVPSPPAAEEVPF